VIIDLPVNAITGALCEGCLRKDRANRMLQQNWPYLAGIFGNQIVDRRVGDLNLRRAMMYNLSIPTSEEIFIIQSVRIWSLPSHPIYNSLWESEECSSNTGVDLPSSTQHCAKRPNISTHSSRRRQHGPARRAELYRVHSTLGCRKSTATLHRLKHQKSSIDHQMRSCSSTCRIHMIADQR